MTVHQFPARYRSKDSEARRARIEARDRVRDAMVDVLAVLSKHHLDPSGDIEVLATVLGSMAAKHGIAPDVLAFAAVSSATVDEVPDASA